MIKGSNQLTNINLGQLSSSNHFPILSPVLKILFPEDGHGSLRMDKDDFVSPRIAKGSPGVPEDG